MPSSHLHDKTQRLEARVTTEQKSLFLRAASLTGRSLSDFVISAVVATATRTVQEYEAMNLSARDREVFVSALLNAPVPGARLRKAAERYKDLTRP
ncbi:MAG: DUF1778 domain-containing protein [Candidatus Binatia bacterium]